MSETKEFNKTVGILSRALTHVLKELKEQHATFTNMHQAYLDLVPILSQTNQLLLQRQGAEDKLIELVDMMTHMQGDMQGVLNENYQIVKAQTSVLRSLEPLLEIIRQKSEETLIFLKKYITTND